MNRSLQEKSAARLAAAQLLYQVALSGDALDAEALAAGYGDYTDARDTPPNVAYLKKPLAGVAQHGAALEPRVDALLAGDWKKERMSPLLLAILRLAVFELAHFRELKAPIIINEYVSLTGRFFGAPETGFVNAALSRIAAELRASG